MTTLAIHGGHADALLPALCAVDETAWVLSARAVPSHELILGRTLREVPADAYLERGPRRLRISSAGYVPAFSQALAADELPVFVHTHPTGRPTRSQLDEVVDVELAAFAAARGFTSYIALILGGTPERPRFTGRIIDADGRERRIDKLRIASRDFRVLLADDRPAYTPDAMFDRQARAFGVDGQALLRTLQIGVVGAGGTGSPTIEILARLGVGDIIAIDDDTVDETNLTRLHGSTAADIGAAKVQLAAALATAYGTGSVVTPKITTVSSRAGAEALRGCDVVFGCTDDHAGRLVLSRLAYHYLIPVFDMGVMVDVNAGEVRGINCRVTMAVPGEACLLCRGQVDARIAGDEMLDDSRRRELAGQGYASGEAGPAPAVVAFTTLTAAHAVSDLLGRLFGYAAATSTQMLIRPHVQRISPAGRPTREGHYCAAESEWGLGDAEPFLGIAGLP